MRSKNRNTAPAQPEASHQRSDLILESAHRRIAAFGFARVTMEEIASDCGLGKASLYYYFPTKEDILCAVLRREQDAFLSRLRSLDLAAADPVDNLRTFVSYRLQFSSRIIDLISPGHPAWNDLRPLFRDLWSKFHKDELAGLQELLRDGARRKRFCANAPEAFAPVILDGLLGLRLLLFGAISAPADPATARTELERRTHQLLEALLGGLLVRPRTHGNHKG